MLNTLILFLFILIIYNKGNHKNDSFVLCIKERLLSKEKIIYYNKIKFNWLHANEWEWADASKMESNKFNRNKKTILIDRKTKQTPYRTKKGWSGEKIIFIEWTATDQSDTNIWMLNKKINPQFGDNNGWPYYGELDIFEMFTQDATKAQNYDFAGNVHFNKVDSYGQMTFHYSKNNDKISTCFCPAAPNKKVWYMDYPSATSSCTAQFKNTPKIKNSIAVIFKNEKMDENSIQLIQYPIIKKNKNNLYELKTSKYSIISKKVYNNKQFYWGTPIKDCKISNSTKDKNFPFFEEFRLVFEEQNDKGQFIINNIEIFTPQKKIK